MPRMRRLSLKSKYRQTPKVVLSAKHHKQIEYLIRQYAFDVVPTNCKRTNFLFRGIIALFKRIKLLAKYNYFVFSFTK
jgi:hypothetical protein